MGYYRGDSLTHPLERGSTDDANDGAMLEIYHI